MKPKLRFSIWTVFYLILVLSAIAVFVFRFNPQPAISAEIIRMLTTLVVVGLITKAGEPVVQILRNVFPARYRLRLSARIGLGLFLLGTLVLVMSIPGVLVLHSLWAIIPAAAAIFCIGVVLLQRGLTGSGAARFYSQMEIGLSLILSLSGFMWLSRQEHDTMPDWAWSLFVIYALIIFPIAVALIIVREQAPHRAN